MSPIPALSALFLALFLVGSPLPAFAAGKPSFTTSSASAYRAALAALDSGKTDAAQDLVASGDDPALNLVLKGRLMAQPSNGYSFDEMAAFITDHPDWPNLKGIRMIVEQKIPDGADPARVVNWFNANDPLTPAGFYRFIDALEATGSQAQATEQIRSRWVNKDMPSDDLAAYQSRFAPVLKAADHWARLDRLLWDNNITAARAMYAHVSAAQQDLAEARIALANQVSTVESLVAKVPASLQKDEGLQYERLRWRRKNGNDEAALDILMDAPEKQTHPSEWWDEANIMLRRAIEKKDFKTAYKLAESSRLTSGFDFVQAEFIAGWVALRFLGKTDWAYKHFANILSDASSPISRARGYYWIGRTYEAAGQKKDAEEAYQIAATLNTTFYGQLAAARLYKKPTISAASEPPIPDTVRKKFMGRDSVRALQRLFEIGETDRAKVFLRAIGEAASQRVEFALMMELAYHMRRPDWAVSVAKAANQKNFILTGGAYPVLSTQIPTPPELALTHALIRQESEFRADAGSPVGARGLMQLMPGTAQDVAKKLGMPYSPDRLIDPDYNVTLGTYFIQKQIDNFDGSYILALAGYNAGPRRVREWMELFGDPRTQAVDPVDWIELIPIYETRNYVQRIIENLQFYRSRLGKGEAPLLIEQDLRR